MEDLIQLLPDSVANQIAAGEVIQRPASALKELLENSIDAGSKRIEIFVKDSGKTLIQVSDDGSGMSAADARMSFERHATSKIRKADDLFTIRTMGFRGEALASIAAIAHVEMKTRRHEEEIGTHVEIEGSQVIKQEPTAQGNGTTISIKNLFYNVPARRNFLKSNAVEARHIIEEFERVAYAHPEVSFSLNQNGIELFRLPISNLRQRIVNINGSSYNERLVPVEESSTILSINGFIGKPEFSRKTRGEQYFFVNRRFIKDSYLHHAVVNAFEELLPKDSYPSYWLFIEIDPSHIDVNIHPTKTEIKFEDERSVYSIVRASVKRSLGQYSVMPPIDFETEKQFDVPHAMRYQPASRPSITINPDYNPFANAGRSVQRQDWMQVYQDQPHAVPALPEEQRLFPETTEASVFIQAGPYIVQKIREGLLFIDAFAAHQRLLYDRFLDQLRTQQPSVQQSLFPVTLSLSPSDCSIVQSIREDLQLLGFDLQDFGPNTFAIQGLPSGVDPGTEKEMLESIIENYKHHSDDISSGLHELLARTMAKGISLKNANALSQAEMKKIVTDLQQSGKDKSIDGRPCMTLLKTDEIAERFR